MLIRSQHHQIRLQQLADGLLGALSVALAYAFRARFPWLNLPELENFADYLWLLLLAGLLSPVLLTQQGFYEPSRLVSRVATIFKIMRGCAYTVLGLVLFLFIVRVQYARSVIILGGTFASFLIYGRHELTQALVTRSANALAQMQKRVLWVGRIPAIQTLRTNLTPAESELINTVAVIDPASDPNNIPALLHQHAVNTVILHLDGLGPATVSRVVSACDHEGVEMLIHPGVQLSSPFRLSMDQLGGDPVMYYRAQSARPLDLALKQVLDYIGAIILIVLTSPLFLLCVILVRFTSAGPVIFRQKRAGLNGKPFVMYKFRTMHEGAEAAQPALAARNEMSGPVFKIATDPRITPVGRFLRRHSLDELPQLWHVLRGEMSLVGPRPLPLEEVSRFTENTQRRRLSIKPGLTCLWQIRGRNDISSFEDWVRLDLEYIDQWSLWLDIKILFATVPVALFGRGGR
ncbi:MAG: sugar transferase [Cephaloticoccus sp.]|nr:sugar transferase [Cephaloticoccus sp.]MCF7760494.1 sugar transferase [Cephaloticoccus sp.]